MIRANLQQTLSLSFFFFTFLLDLQISLLLFLKDPFWDLHFLSFKCHFWTISLINIIVYSNTHKLCFGFIFGIWTQRWAFKHQIPAGKQSGFLPNSLFNVDLGWTSENLQQMCLISNCSCYSHNRNITDLSPTAPPAGKNFLVCWFRFVNTLKMKTKRTPHFASQLSQLFLQKETPLP